MSLLGKLAEARAELEAHHEDPFLETVKAAVRDAEPFLQPRCSTCFACLPPRPQHAASPP